MPLELLWRPPSVVDLRHPALDAQRPAAGSLFKLSGLAKARSMREKGTWL